MLVLSAVGSSSGPDICENDLLPVCDTVSSLSFLLNDDVI